MGFMNDHRISFITLKRQRFRAPIQNKSKHLSASTNHKYDSKHLSALAHHSSDSKQVNH